jgi:5-methylcytosine-specific restriction endonuclease McrA
MEDCIVACVLNRPTLVLNRHWQPVAVARVARALQLMWNNSAVAVDPSDFSMLTWNDWSKIRPQVGEAFVRGVTYHFRAPEVIVLTKFDRMPRFQVSFSRRNLYRRDAYTCQYCGAKPGTKELTIDHVVPRSKGGTSSWDNCVLACLDCNRKKADRSLDKAGLKLRSKPTKPRWKPLYSADDLRIDSWSKFLSEAYWSVPLAE